MKRTALGCTKFRLLKRRLGLPDYALVGVLESLWHLAARETPRGDIGRLSDEAILVGIDYDGDGKALLEALVAEHWLDRHPTHRLVVHDWHEHADDAVKRFIARNHTTFADIDTPGETAEEHVPTCRDKSGHVETSPVMTEQVGTCPDMTEHVATSPDMSRLPMPLPLPLPEARSDSNSNRESTDVRSPAEPTRPDSIRAIELPRNGKPKPRAAPEAAGIDSERIRAAVAEYCPVSENDATIVPRVVDAARAVDPAIRGETLELVVHACVPKGHPGIASPAWFERTVPDFLRSHRREYDVLRGLADPELSLEARTRAANEYLCTAGVPEREKRCAALVLLQLQERMPMEVAS